MSAKNLFRRLMTKAFRTAGTAPIRKRARQLSRVESLEDRVTPAVLYVDNLADFSVTVNNVGGPGADPGDIVTWNAGAGSQHSPSTVTGLTFGTNAHGTIQSAVSAATAGDTIRVAGGTFSELVTVNKQLIIQGNQVGVDGRDPGRTGLPATESVVNAAGLGGAFTISASDVVIDGFTMQGQTGGFPGAAIGMQPGTAGTEVRNSIIQNNVVGIFVSNNSATNQTVIERNLFRNNTNPGAASGISIYADEFTAGPGMQNVRIDSNTFTNTSSVVNSWALGISNSNAATPFTNITFSNNVVTNHGRGMFFFNTNGATISGNEITGATNYAIGVFTIFGTDNNANFDILNNTLSNNNRGVWIDGYTGPLDVNSNDLSGNTTAGLQNDDADALVNAENNWWGSATGPTTPSNPGGTGSPITGTNAAGVDFSPFLVDGTDGEPGTPGFQPIAPVAVVGTAGNDTLIVTATGPNAGTYSLNGGPAVPFMATRFTFTGLGSDDLLRINNPAGGLFAPALGVVYDGGGQPGDAIENLGGTALSGTYRPGPGNGDGVIFHDGAAGDQTITFSGLAPALDTVAEPTFTVFATDAANTITLSNGLVTGDGRLRVSIDVMEPIDFANKTAVVIQGGDNVAGGDLADTILVNFTELSTGLVGPVTVDAETGGDTITVQATPAATITNVNGEGDTDTINIGGTTNTLDNILGGVTVFGGTPAGATDTLNINDGNDTTNNTYTVNSTQVVRTGGPTVAYSEIEVLNLNAGDGGDTINVTTTAAGTVTSIFGNDADDAVVFGNGVSLNGGTVDGGAGGADTIDYAAYTTPVVINLGSTVATLAATADGTQENPPNASTATATVMVTNYNPLTKTFDISGTVTGLFNTIIDSHIHRNPIGTNGPVIVPFGAGIFTPTGPGNFTFSLTGVALDPRHEAAFLGGLTYFNIHTNVFPGGELRGQIVPTALFASGAGTATGTGGVSNVENAVGGSGVFNIGTTFFADSIVGDSTLTNVNVLSGGPGNDVIVGARGADAMLGGTGDDFLVWSNGDGNDQMDGNADTDTVVVNGNPAGADAFTVAAGAGGRVAFSRATPPFSLDVGTTERLNVSGYGGDDTFTVTSLVGVTDLTTILMNGLDGSDTFDVIPDANVTLTAAGHPPTGTPPGDTLIYRSTGTKTVMGPNSGQVTGSGVQAVNFINVEQVQTGGGGQALNDVLNLPGLPGGQDTLPNIITIQRDATGTFLQIFLDPDAAGVAPNTLISTQLYANVNSITVNGGTDNDRLVINHANGLVGGLVGSLDGGITYNGGAGTDSLAITGNPGSVAARTTYRVGATQDAGTYVVDPDDNRGPGLATAANGDEMTVTFTGLEPIDDDTPAAVYDLIMNTTNDGTQIVNGGLLNGVAAVQLIDLTATFETTRFANKTTARIMGGSGGDAFILAYTTAAAGLTTLEIYGHVAPDVVGQPPDDNANETFILTATAAITNSFFGDGGNELFAHTGGQGANLNNITGTLNITGGAGTADLLWLQDVNTAGPDTITLTATQLTGGAPATINYDTLESMFYEATQGADTINITSTALGTQYAISGDGGSDTYTIGNTAADFNASVFDGSLDTIAGALTIMPDFNAGAGAADVVNVDDSGTAGLAGAASISNVGTTTFTSGPVGSPLAPATLTFTALTTRLAGFTGVNIDYYHGPIGAAPNALERLNVRTSTGADTVAVNATTATIATTLDGREDNDTISIQGNALIAANTFTGFDGNDTFKVNLAAGTTVTGASLVINGDTPANDPTNRDTVNVNANAAGDISRTVTITYVSTTSGDVDVTGLGTLIDVNAAETLTYNGDAANNDSVTVVDTASAVDPAQVTPTASGATYTRNGGVSPIEPGPDLTLTGLGGATPLSLDGADPTTFPGDRLLYAGPAPAIKTIRGTNTGSISAPGVITVAFTSYERVESTTANGFNDVIDVPSIPGGQDGTANTLTVQLDATGVFLQIFFQNGAGPNTLISSQPLANVNSLTVNGGTDGDTLVIDDVNGLPVFGGIVPGLIGGDTNNLNIPGAASVLFNGSDGLDALVYRLDVLAANADTINQTYAVGEGDGGGSGVGTSEGEILTQNATLGRNLLLYFTGLEPITTMGTPGGTLTVLGDLNSNILEVVDADAVGGPAGTTRVQETFGPFESFDFAANAFTALEVYGMGGSDGVALVSVDPAEVSLATIRLDGDSNVGGDISSDTIRVQSLPATSTANMFGGAGDDLFLVTTALFPFFPGVTTGILGPVNVSPAGDEVGTDRLTANDSAGGSSRTVLVTDITIEGITNFAGAPDITYGGGDQIETVDVVTSNSAGDTINIQSTRTGSVYNIDTGAFGAGSDTVNISGDAPANAGDLNAIDGQVNLSFGTGTDTLNVSDLGDTAGDTYTLTLVGAVSELTFGDGAAAVDIRYNVIFAGGATSSLDDFNLVGSTTGNNTYNINNTTGTANNTVSDGDVANTGDATFNIQANAVQAGATNTFNGFGGVDTFNVNLAAATSVPNAAGTTFVVDGGDPAATTDNRDRVNLNLPAGDGVIRTVGFTYADSTKSSGDVNVTGLGTPTFIDLNAVETVVYTGGADNNDILTVTGTAATDDLTVAPLTLSSALVFLDGDAFDGPPETIDTVIPGVGGGSFGPDLFLNGMATATGLTFNGGGGTGDQLYVYGTSEADLESAGDPFGFGPGVIIPGSENTLRPGGALPNANDNVVATDSVVRFTDAAGFATFNPIMSGPGATPPNDVRVRVNLVTATFTQPSALTPGLIVNTGDEAAPALNGVADDIIAVLSNAFRFQVNGGEPGLGGTPAAPTGDQMRVITPAELTIYSDLNDPPNVSITSGGSFPLGFSSIERLTLQPGNGIVNILGDNNNPATPQADTFIIEGTAPQAFQLDINGSAPINVVGAVFLNVFAGELDDTTAITPFANAIMPWNMVVTVDGQATGAAGDRLIYTSVANLFDDNHLVATGLGAGRINAPGIGSATTNQVIRFLGTEQVTIISNPGDADELTLSLTNAADLATFVFDPSDPTTPAITTPPSALPLPVVTDDILTNYFNVVVETANTSALTVNGNAGGDTFFLDLSGSAAGLLPIPLTVNAGTGSDTIVVVGNGGLPDLFSNTPGASADTGDVSIDLTDVATVSYTGVENLSYDGGGGAGDDIVVLIGTAGADAVTLTGTPGAREGQATVSGQPAISFAVLGSGAGTAVGIATLGGDDLITIEHVTDWGITTVAINGGPPTASDALNIVGTPGDDTFVFNPATGVTTVTAGATTTTYTSGGIEVFNLDGAANVTNPPGDTLSVTSAMMGIALPPSGSLTTSTLRMNYQNFETVTVVTRPTAADDTATVDEDSSVVIDVLGNDTVANVPATLTLISLPTNGTAVVLAANDPANPFSVFFLGAAGRQAIRYSPNANFPTSAASATDGFAYRVTDANGQTNLLPDPVVTITVNAVNDAPVNTVPGPQTTDEDTPLAITGFTVADIDFAPTGPETLTVTLSVPMVAGTLDVTAAGAAVVGGKNSTTLTVTGTMADINATLATLIYSPALNFNGNTTLTIVTDDGGNIGTPGPLSATSTVAITVVAVNDAPTVTIAGRGGQTTDEDTALVFTAGSGNGITVDDVDAGTASLTLTLVATNGTLTLASLAGLTGVTGNGTGTVGAMGTIAALNAALEGLTYLPNLNYNGPASLTVSVSDNGNTGNGGQQSASDSVPITVNPINDAPTPNPDTVATAEDTPVTFDTRTNDTDVETPSADLTVTQINGTAVGVGGVVVVPGGTVTLNGDGTLTFAPDANVNGTFTFTYNVIDTGDGASAPIESGPATVTVTISAVNDAPTVTVAAATTDEDTPVTIPVSVADLIDDATSTGTGEYTVALTVTNGTLTLGTVAGLTGVTGNGTASINATGTLATLNAALGGLSYSPTLNFNGAALLSVSVDDNGNIGSGGPLTATATAAITVNPINDDPVANPDTVVTAEDTAVTVDVRTNDNDVETPTSLPTVTEVDGAPITVGTPIVVAGGMVSLNGDGTLTFTLDPDVNGTFTFTYRVTDTGDGASAPITSNLATVTVTVSAVNDTPTVNVTTPQATDEDTALVFSLGNGNAIVVGDPLDDLSGLGTGAFTAALTVTNGTLTLATVSGLTGVSGNGTASINATGTLVALNAALDGLRFDPIANFNGSATLNVSLSDNGNIGSGGPLTASAAVDITVNPVNDDPVASPDSFTVAEDSGATTFDVLINDTDIDGDTLTVSAVTQPGGGAGTVTFTANDVTFMPALDFNGTTSFSYSVDDGNGGTATTTVTVTVTPANDAPVNTVPGPQTTAEDTAITFGGSISVADVDVGSGDVRVTLTVLNGRLNLVPTFGVLTTGNGTGAVTAIGTAADVNAALATLAYTPNPNFNGSDTLTVTTSDLGTTGDGGPQETVSTVDITVNPVNDAPVNTVPGPQTTAEDTAITFGGSISIADLDADTGVVTVALSVTNGTLTATASGAATVSGGDTGSVVITGIVDDVNDTLASLVYTPNLNYSGPDTLTVDTTDNGNTGSGGALTAADTVAITVTPVADAPQLMVTTPASGVENVAIPLTIAAAVSDTDGSESLTIEILGVPAGTTFSRGLSVGGVWRLSPADLPGLTITVADGPATLNLMVTAISTDGTGGPTAMITRPLMVVVTNTDPTAALDNSGPVNEGSTAVVTFSDQTDATPTDITAGFRYSYDFDNDNTFDVGNGTYAGSVASPTTVVPASFLDDGPGTRTVRARIVDKDGGFFETTTVITINNVAPTATFTATGRLIERQPVTVSFTNAFDPSQADTDAGFLYSFDFNGDGTFEIEDSTEPTATFTPPAEGTFNIAGRIKDKDGDFTDYPANGGGGVAIANVDVYVVGAGAGGSPMINVYDQNRNLKFSMFAYSVDFTGGVQVATADVNGDGVPDIITGAGNGGAPMVNVFDGTNGDIIYSFFAYERGFRGGVQVAGGDVDGDGFADIIAGAGNTGAPHVVVFSGKDGTLMKSFMAYADSFRGGVQVAAGDVLGNGRVMIVAGAGVGGAPHIVVIDPMTTQVLKSFFAFDSTFRGGVNVATGDIDLDGRAEIIFGSGPGGGPAVGIIDAPSATQERMFFGFDEVFRGGVRVASSDLNGDQKADLVLGSGPGRLPQTSGSVVRNINGQTLKELDNFYPFDPNFDGGVFVG